MTTAPAYPGSTFTYEAPAIPPRRRSGDVIFALAALGAMSPTATAGDTLDSADDLTGSNLLSKLGASASAKSLLDCFNAVDDRMVIRVLDATPTNDEAVAAWDALMGTDLTGGPARPTILLAPGLTAGGAGGSDRADVVTETGTSPVAAAMQTHADNVRGIALCDVALEASAADAGQRGAAAGALTAARSWVGNNHGNRMVACAGPGWDGASIIPASGTIAGALLDRSALRGRQYGVHFAPIIQGAERYYSFGTSATPDADSQAKTLLEDHIMVAVQTAGEGRYVLGQRMSEKSNIYRNIWSILRVIDHAEEVARAAGRGLIGEDTGPVANRDLAAVMQDAMQSLVTARPRELRHALVEVDEDAAIQGVEGAADFVFALGIVNPLVSIRNHVRLEAL